MAASADRCASDRERTAAAIPTEVRRGGKTDRALGGRRTRGFFLGNSSALVRSVSGPPVMKALLLDKFKIFIQGHNSIRGALSDRRRKA